MMLNLMDMAIAGTSSDELRELKKNLVHAWKEKIPFAKMEDELGETDAAKEAEEEAEEEEAEEA